jgi:hypothetical protein
MARVKAAHQFDLTALSVAGFDQDWGTGDETYCYKSMRAADLIWILRW